MIRRYKLGATSSCTSARSSAALLSLIGPERARASRAPRTCRRPSTRTARRARRAARVRLDRHRPRRRRDVRGRADAERVRAALVAAGAVRGGRGRRRGACGSRPAGRATASTSTTTVIPQEAGLNERAVSFTKGCYVGQETVARLYYRGKPNRHLRGLRLDGAASSRAPRCGSASARSGALGSVVESPAPRADRARARAPRGGARARARGRRRRAPRRGRRAAVRSRRRLVAHSAGRTVDERGPHGRARARRRHRHRHLGRPAGRPAGSVPRRGPVDVTLVMPGERPGARRGARPTREQLETALARWREAGLEAEGDRGDADPVEAVHEVCAPGPLRRGDRLDAARRELALAAGRRPVPDRRADRPAGHARRGASSMRPEPHGGPPPERETSRSGRSASSPWRDEARATAELEPVAQRVRSRRSAGPGQLVVPVTVAPASCSRTATASSSASPTRSPGCAFVAGANGPRRRRAAAGRRTRTRRRRWRDRLRLRQLVEPEQPAEERARLLLAAGRRRELDVVEPAITRRTASSSVTCASSCGGEPTPPTMPRLDELVRPAASRRARGRGAARRAAACARGAPPPSAGQRAPVDDAAAGDPERVEARRARSGAARARAARPRGSARSTPPSRRISASSRARRRCSHAARS